MAYRRMKPWRKLSEQVARAASQRSGTSVTGRNSAATQSDPSRGGFCSAVQRPTGRTETEALRNLLFVLLHPHRMSVCDFPLESSVLCISVYLRPSAVEDNLHVKISIIEDKNPGRKRTAGMPIAGFAPNRIGER